MADDTLELFADGEAVVGINIAVTRGRAATVAARLVAFVLVAAADCGVLRGRSFIVSTYLRIGPLALLLVRSQRVARTRIVAVPAAITV